MDLGFIDVGALARTYTNIRKQPVYAQTDRTPLSRLLSRRLLLGMLAVLSEAL